MDFFRNLGKEEKSLAKSSSCETYYSGLFQEKNTLLIKHVLLKIKQLQIIKTETSLKKQTNFCPLSENNAGTI